MAKRLSKSDRKKQELIDRRVDLMERIINKTEIADRIPNKANLLFGEDDVIFSNGEPRWYSELMRVSKRRFLKSKTKASRAKERKVAA